MEVNNTMKNTTKQYIGILEKGYNPKTKSQTYGNKGVIYTLEKDGMYHSTIGVFSEGEMLHDLHLNYIAPYGK